MNRRYYCLLVENGRLIRKATEAMPIREAVEWAEFYNGCSAHGGISAVIVPRSSLIVQGRERKAVAQ